MNILESGNEFRFYNSTRIVSLLPNGVFTFDCNLAGPYLIKVDPLREPSKVYSNDKQFINHVVHTWDSTNESLGVLLTGKKGLGKSFTANLLCITVGKNLPIIKITREVAKSEGLIDFLNEIKQDHIIYIDEFEKIFQLNDKNEDLLPQAAFLSFLDGGNSNGVRRFFVITTNQSVDDLFINRPTRLRYVRDYDGMEMDIIKEIVSDRLTNQGYLDDLIEHVDQDSLNIDILIKIIDEINLHNIPYSQFKDFFNYKISTIPFDVYIQLPGFGEPIQFDYMDSHTLNLIKAGKILRRGFNYDSPTHEYYFTWELGTNGPIEQIDASTYKLKVSGSKNKIGLESIDGEVTTTLIIRKQIKHLIF